MRARPSLLVGLLLLASLLVAAPVAAQSGPSWNVPGGPGLGIPTTPPPGQPAYCVGAGNLVTPQMFGCPGGQTPLATPSPPGQPAFCRDVRGMVVQRPTGCFPGEIPEGAAMPWPR